jgi:hypothetical protein
MDYTLVIITLRILDEVSLDFQQLELKNENCSARDAAAGAAFPIRKFGWDVELPLAVFLHKLHCFGPACDHLVGSKPAIIKTDIIPSG